MTRKIILFNNIINNIINDKSLDGSKDEKLKLCMIFLYSKYDAEYVDDIVPRIVDNPDMYFL